MPNYCYTKCQPAALFVYIFHPRKLQKMRKRELQSIPLKLAELKEYDALKAERTLNKSKNTSPDENTPKEHSPIANVGPKTTKEIQERLNTTM